MPLSRLSAAASVLCTHACWSASDGELQGSPLVRRAGAGDVGLDAAADVRVGVLVEPEDVDGDEGAAREGELGTAAAGGGDGLGEVARAAGSVAALPPLLLGAPGVGAASPVSATAPSAGLY